MLFLQVFLAMACVLAACYVTIWFFFMRRKPITGSWKNIKADDVYSRWKTGQLTTVYATCHTLHGIETRDVECELCNAPLGDFIQSYILHLSVPRQLRDFAWADAEGKMRKALNSYSLDFPGEFFRSKK